MRSLGKTEALDEGNRFKIERKSLAQNAKKTLFEMRYRRKTIELIKNSLEFLEPNLRQEKNIQHFVQRKMKEEDLLS